MQQSFAYTLSPDDQLLIETHQLGMPLGIYRRKLSTIYFFGAVDTFIFLTGIFSFIIAILIQQHVIGANSSSGFDVFQPIMSGVFATLIGLLHLVLGVPRERSRHIIVCEQGLIHACKTLWFKHVVDVFHWDDISSIDQAFFGQTHSINYRNQKVQTLKITGGYQNMEELISLIEQQSGRNSGDPG
jgi:hypothetical protein